MWKKTEYLFDLRVGNRIFLMPKSTNNLEGKKVINTFTSVPKPAKLTT